MSRLSQAIKSRSASDQFVTNSYVDSLLGLAILVPMSGVGLLTMPIWIQTTLIGSVWAALVLVGCVCAWSRHRLASGLVSIAIAMISHRAMHQLTDLGHNACWLVVLSVLSGGWGLGLLMARRSGKWSLWDIGCLTTLVAVASWFLPRVESQFDLVCRTAPAILGGLILSAMSIQWVRYDRWSFFGLAMLGLGLIAGSGTCLWAAPSGMDVCGVLVWMLIGPAGVIVAQATIVLAYLAATGRRPLELEGNRTESIYRF